jgi:hypothetical protein
MPRAREQRMLRWWFQIDSQYLKPLFRCVLEGEFLRSHLCRVCSRTRGGSVLRNVLGVFV